MNPEDKGRRDVLKGALGTGVIAAGAVTAPSFLFPALAQGENLVPLTDDASEAFKWRPIEPNTTHTIILAIVAVIVRTEFEIEV